MTLRTSLFNLIIAISKSLYNQIFLDPRRRGNQILLPQWSSSLWIVFLHSLMNFHDNSFAVVNHSVLALLCSRIFSLLWNTVLHIRGSKETCTKLLLSVYNYCIFELISMCSFRLILTNICWNSINVSRIDYLVITIYYDSFDLK